MLRKLINNIGFSLIELLVSLTILCIVIIATSSLFVCTARINKLSEKQYKATLIAKNFMELIKASQDLKVGRSVYIVDEVKIIVDINTINKYKDEMYEINVEVIIDDDTLENLKGYKILYY